MYVEKGIALKQPEAPAVVTEEKPAAPVKAEPASKPVYDFFKRAFDIVCSALGLLVLSPLFLVLVIVILAERSGKGAFFKQKRMGKNGRYIYIYKFRSMVDDAENVERWLNKNQLRQYYSEYKVADDPRVTKTGGFLRRTKLDELPQLLNVLKGDLSLVGPRPIQEAELELYGDDKELLLSIKPGLTGYWQAYCSGDTTYSNRKRQRMELFYVKRRNAGWDIKICFATVGAILKKGKKEK